MRIVIQRVNSARVEIQQKDIAHICHGLLLLVGIHRTDSLLDADRLVKKVVGLRIFEDAAGCMNLSIREVNGEILVISEFTLCADTRRGNRPSFSESAKPSEARKLFDYFVQRLSHQTKNNVLTGQFGTHMQVSFINDGPCTFWLDSQV